MSSNQSSSKSGNKKTSAYDGAFEQHLIDHGIFFNNRAQKPDNWKEINHRMAQPRPSLSPSCFSDAAFETFVQTNEDALTEATVMSKAFPVITGSANIPSAENLPFGNLKDLTDGSLVKARPDFYDGSHPAEIDEPIRKDLGSYIVPSTNTAAPCLPNFFTEGKGPTGSAIVGRRQACYDGTLGARGIHELRSCTSPETIYDNNAYTITSTYHGATGDLTIYTTHPTPSTDPSNPVGYRMTQLNGWKMTGNPETFRQGATALRNARDWAKEQRDELVTAANSRVVDMPMETSTLESSGHSILSSSTNEPILLESDTSADELALNDSVSVNSSHKRLAGRSEKRPSNPGPKRRPKKSTRAVKCS